MLYNIVLVSAKHQYESATGTHVSLPLESPHPSRSSQSPGLSSLSHSANPYWLSVLYGGVYVSILLSYDSLLSIS